MSFSFTIYIDPASLQELIGKNNFFGAVKTNVGTPIQVQWFGVTVEGAEIRISWTPKYEVFFTNSPTTPGTVIQQGRRQPAQLSKSYAYSKNAWSPSDQPKVDHTQIGIYNNFSDSGIRHFGVNEVVTINGKARRTPVAVVPVGYYGGSAIIQPREIVNIYFTQKTSDDDGNLSGIVVSSVPPSLKLTLQAGVPQYIKYSDEKWILLPGPPSNDFLGSPARPITWHQKFSFDFAAPVDAVLFIQWLQETLGHLLADAPAVIDRSFVVQVLSDKDRTEELLALKGKWFEEPLVITPLEDGSEDLSGYRVRIDSVQVYLTTFDKYLSQLPAGYSSAVHTH